MELAEAQHGFVHRSQILALGISPGSIRHRRDRGRLHEVFPAVFAVGHTAPTPLGPPTAALRYANDDAALSHAMAASLWGMITSSPPEVTLTVMRRLRSRPGLRVHQVPALDPRDVRLCHGLPVTAPARTLIDLAADASTPTLAQALNEARVLGLVTDAELHEALKRAPGRTGTQRLRAVLADEQGPVLTRSEGERKLRRLIARAELPMPVFNIWLHGHLVDALWTEAKVVVEVDGYRVHGPRAAFEHDRRRDQRLAAEGFLVLRITWRQLEEEPLAVVGRLAQALARRA